MVLAIMVRKVQQDSEGFEVAFALVGNPSVRIHSQKTMGPVIGTSKYGVTFDANLNNVILPCASSSGFQ